MDEATKAVFKFRFQKLLADNPDTIRLLRGKEEVNVVNMNKVMEAGPSAVCTFSIYDEALFLTYQGAFRKANRSPLTLQDLKT